MSPAEHSWGVDSSIPAAAGIGLRFPHHQQVLQQQPEVRWFEVHAENYLGGGRVRRTLEAVRHHYPISLHGVGLSLGSADGIDAAHLERIAQLIRDIEPGLISEHLSWSAVDGDYLADLLPLPMTEEALAIVSRHVQQTQQRLQQRILIENPSSYVQYQHSCIPEWEFLCELCARTGCGLLCDVNNIFVSCSNHGCDPLRYLDGLPARCVGEIHLAGHALHTLPSGRVVRIDNHGTPIASEVWSLYAQALQRFGARPTLIEWDTDIPALEVLQAQAAIAQGHLTQLTSNEHARAA